MDERITDHAGTTIRVFIVDDHPTVCEGLRHRIASQSDMLVCGEAADVAAARKMIAHLLPDVVIVDLALKQSNGLELIKTIQTRREDVHALVHTMFDETVYADRCLRAGAMGYINKEADPNEVIDAIRNVHAGRVHLSQSMSSALLGRAVGGAAQDADPLDTLTDRQLEVFRLMGEGRSAAQIADRLHISVHTVETHRDNIKHKLKVGALSELTRLAVLWVSKQR